MMMQLHLVSTYPSLPIALVLSAVFPLLIAFVFGHWKIPPSFPKGIPRAGGRKIFCGLKAYFRGWLSGRLNLSEGYKKFNRYDQLFIYSNANLRPQAILPAKDLEWLLRQPDSILSFQEVMNESISFKQVFSMAFSPELAKIGSLVASRFFTQNIGQIQSALADEVRQNIDQEFGKDCYNWKPVCLMEVMQKVILRVSSRISWGSPLCHDDALMRSFATILNFHGAAMVVCGQLIPWFLQPLLGACFSVPLHFIRKRALATTTPLVKEWIAQIRQEEREQVPEKDSRVPYNAVTSFIRVARRVYGCENVDEERLSLVILIFWTLFPFMTTVPSSSAAILDIASAPPEIGLYQQLRQEARKVLTSEEEWVEPSSFNKLHYTDSAIRETLRLTPVVLHGSNREIIHPSGLTMPSGQHLPRGMWVAGSTLDIHMDERFYAEAQQYKPFRFVKGQTSEDGTGMSEQKINRVATASTFLTFGTGRHAW
ncbi:hypothetical protein CNMCM8980_000199 [Aspergillus fumigatiaffinis]|nr:hypothetical protein CNMCM6457_007118 [Aspergillus fumigatiaffinis]KAF4243059.1 hypothetical protein CNMCM8980_000199 [Aspergillus fumigatiaffinis]